MPRATVDQTPGEKVDLKTCPEGWVILRRLSYGQKITRREQSSSMTMNSKGKRNNSIDLKMLAQNSTLFDFMHCLVDHNLEDELGNKLNLHTPEGVLSLDPKIGEEIEVLIDNLNNFEDEDNPEGNS